MRRVCRLQEMKLKITPQAKLDCFCTRKKSMRSLSARPKPVKGVGLYGSFISCSLRTPHLIHKIILMFVASGIPTVAGSWTTRSSRTARRSRWFTSWRLNIEPPASGWRVFSRPQSYYSIIWLNWFNGFNQSVNYFVSAQTVTDVKPRRPLRLLGLGLEC